MENWKNLEAKESTRKWKGRSRKKRRRRGLQEKDQWEKKKNDYIWKRRKNGIEREREKKPGEKES